MAPYLVALLVVGGLTQGRAQQPLVFDGVTVVDVEHGALVPSQRVVIVGNRIQMAGPMRTIKSPKGAQVVDAQGKYLIPGLWDLHTHSGRYADRFHPLFLANGVTGIRDAGSPVTLDTLVAWRREILAGTRVGPPRQLLSGRSIRDEKGDWGWLVPRPCERIDRINEYESCVKDSSDARYYVDSLKAAGADMVKPRGMTAEIFGAIAAEARRIGVLFGGHAVETGVTAEEMSDSGASIVDHGVESCSSMGDSIDGCRAAAERFRRNGTWLVPTLFITVPNRRPHSQGIHERFMASIRSFWADSTSRWSGFGGIEEPAVAGIDSLSLPSSDFRIMQDVGLPILAGTDVGGSGSDAEWNGFRAAGFSLHAELAMYVAEGMTPLGALQSATINPAKLLRATDSLGTVAAGKLADLVLLDADPLADITNTAAIRGVVANGRYFDRAALDGILADVRAKVNKKP